jgi:uncharacterized membrane protein YeiH
VDARFQLPLAFDLGAVFFFGLTGALEARRHGYDIVGVFSMALVTALGGALIRDGMLLQESLSVVLKDPRYLLATVAATLVGATFVARQLDRWPRLIAALDAVGLGAYGIVGTQKALAAGLGEVAAVFVGLTNAVGGGLLRDVIVRSEPLVFKPGQFYVLAALAGCVVFAAAWGLHVPATKAGLAGILVTVLTRWLSIRFNWRTAPWGGPSGEG